MGLSIILLAAASLMLDNWSFEVQSQPTKTFVVVPDKKPDADAVPKPVDPPVPVALEQQYHVVMYTADWCGPCRNWKANEGLRAENAGIRVFHKDPIRGVPKIPEFRLIRDSDEAVISKWVGYVSTADLQSAMRADANRSGSRPEKAVKSVAPGSLPPGFYNPAIYRGTSGSHVSRETLISHLLNDGIHRGKHSFAELSSLSDDALNSLHNREHGWR